MNKRERELLQEQEFAKLLKRVRDLEEYLGIFYVVDQNGAGEYKQDADDQWSVLPATEYRLKTLEEERRGREKKTEK